MYTNLNVQDSISEVLLGLDKIAQSQHKRCVVLMDEFQQISQIKGNELLEASIRHAVERSQYVSYLFCGSSRHLLEQMFTSKNRPFYQLCDLMTLNRIKAVDYQPFLQKAAQAKWQQDLDVIVIADILKYTACHPRHVNALCGQLWLADMPPDQAVVVASWQEYIETQITFLANDMDKLSANQRTVLGALAVLPTSEPMGQKFSRFANLPTASVQQALKMLLQKDFVHVVEGVYRVLDPAMEVYLKASGFF